MAVTLKNTIFWDVTPCGSYKNLLTRATWHHIPEHGILLNNNHKKLNVSFRKFLHLFFGKLTLSASYFLLT
jgi:hypothetical protein